MNLIKRFFIWLGLYPSDRGREISEMIARGTRQQDEFVLPYGSNYLNWKMAKHVSDLDSSLKAIEDAKNDRKTFRTETGTEVQVPPRPPRKVLQSVSSSGSSFTNGATIHHSNNSTSDMLTGAAVGYYIGSSRSSDDDSCSRSSYSGSSDSSYSSSSDSYSSSSDSYSSSSDW